MPKYLIEREIRGAAEHGRGIYLINQLMDEVWYERRGTEIHMRKN